MKRFNASIITSIICRFFGIVAVLAFVYLMVVLTGKLSCLWLLWLVLTVEFIPTYEFKSNAHKEDTKKDKNNSN